MAQLASARLSEREVSDFNVCFDFPLIRVAIALNTRKYIALNTRKTEH